MPHVDDGTLHALLDGALRAEAPGRADAVEAHLAACADCRARLDAAAALRHQAGDVLAALDAGLAADADAPTAPVPDFQEVLARAAAAEAEPRAPAEADPRRAGLRRQYRWTRGLAWAATIVVALGTGYLIRDLAGPTGEIPRARAPRSGVPAESTADQGAPAGPDRTGAARTAGEDNPAAAAPSVDQGGAGAEAEAVGSGAQPAAGPTAPTTGGVAGQAGAGREAAADLAAKAMEDEAPAEEVAEPESAEAPVPAPEFTPMTVARDTAAALLDRVVRQSAEQTRVMSLESQAPPAAGAGGVTRGRAPEASARMVPTAAPVRLEASTADADALMGCYALELGEWSPAGVSAEGTHMIEVGRLLLRPVIAADPGGMGQPGAFWMPTAPDAVRLVWSNGVVGVELDLALRGDTLEGVATAGSEDMTAPAPTAPARAVRVDCRDSGG